MGIKKKKREKTTPMMMFDGGAVLFVLFRLCAVVPYNANKREKKN